ncbi:MAG: aldo/keto reductase [Phycisphaerae bacterium]|nr:aldo/keto reductase [Phycisphaerae bacterium]
MIYRKFGKTGLSIPVMSCGGMRYQFGWQDSPLKDIPQKNQDNLEATIHRALELGINHIETARGYGSSERQLGMVLPTIPRNDLIVQTKVVPKENPDEFIADFRDSLERLKLDYVDLLAIHGINHEPTLQWSIRPGGCLEAARKLQQEGLVRHIGFSTHGPTDIIVRAIQHEGDSGFDYFNLHWYYINQLNWPAIQEANKRDMGVFIISPTDKGGMLFDPPEKLSQLTAPLHPIVFNDLFCLANNLVHTISIGASCPGDFDLHVETLPLLENAQQNLKPILNRLQSAMVEGVGEQLIDPFGLNLPEWNDCPDQVNIRIIVWLWTLAKAFDMVEYGKKRYSLMGNADHWFPGQKLKDVDEVAWEKISQECGLNGKLIDILHESKDLFGGEEAKRLSQSSD